MRQKRRAEKGSMTSMQRQAILVCVVCALAVLLTAGITLTLLKRGKPDEEPASSVESEAQEQPDDGISDYYQIDFTSGALLTETADAGDDYVNQTLFLGDSNTVRLYNNGLISLQQFCAKEGIGTQAALNEGVVTFKNDDTLYTLAQAVAKMKPRRVVITLGTNDTGMSVQDFISSYTALVQAIQTAYPYTDIIVNTVPPIPADHSTYPNMEQTKIDDFNMALLPMCEQLGVRFLNSAEALKDESGYGRADYYTTGDIHLKSSGLKALLSYLRTHAWETEDRRPDTSNIPTRTLEYSSNPSSAVPAPSSSEESSEVLYEARYQVEKSGGGTLSGENEEGKTQLVYSVTDEEQSVSVTAVPDSSHVFVKWSDGVTSRTRTDTDFKQNVNVTAVFAEAAVHIECRGSGFFGTFYTFKAALKGKYSSADNLRWFANGEEVTEAAGMTTVTFMVDNSMLYETYKVYAVLSYNGSSVTSNTLVITMNGIDPESSSSSSASSDSASSASSSESSSSSSASSGSSSESSSSSSTSSSGSSSGSTSSSSGASTSSSSSVSSGSSSSSSSVSSSSSGSSSGSSSSVSSSSRAADSSSSSSTVSSSEPTVGDMLQSMLDGIDTE